MRISLQDGKTFSEKMIKKKLLELGWAMFYTEAKKFYSENQLFLVGGFPDKI